MRVSQAIKLGHRSLMGHKRRNLTTIIITSVMFGFMIGVIFLMQGVQNTVRQVADAALGDSYYVGVETDFWNEQQCHHEPIPDQSNSYNIICNGHDIAKLEENVKALGGEIIALSQTRAMPISPAGAAPFLQADLNTVPDNVVPVLESSNTILYNLLGDNSYSNSYVDIANYVRNGTIASAISKTREIDYNGGATLMAMGVIPGGNIQRLQQTNGLSLNPLDYILDFVGMNSNIGGGEMVIDNGSPATKAYLENLEAQDALAQNMISAVLKFNTFAAAETFANENTCQVSETSMGCKKEFFLNTVFDNRVVIARTNQMIWWGLGIAEIVFLVIAAIIMLFTFLKVLHGEIKSISLYRSLGASMRDIVMIYLAYTLEVCLLAIGLALLIGLSMALIIGFLNSANMADMLTAAYYRDVQGPLVLVGWNFDILKIILVMLCVVPITLLLCTKTLRQRYIFIGGSNSGRSVVLS